VSDAGTRAGRSRLSLAGSIVLLVFAWSLPVSLFGMQLGAILGAALVLARTLLQRGRNLSPTPLDRPIAWLLVAVGLSLLLAPRPPTSFRAATSFWVVVAFYATWFLLDSRRTLRRAVTGVLALACAAAAFGVFQSLTGRYPLGELIHPGIDPLLQPVPGRPGLYRAVGMFFSRLTLAHVLLFPLCWAVGLALERLRLRWRLLSLGAAVVLTCGVVFTWTRAALVAAAVTGAVLAVSRLRRGWPRRS